jgi:hypothetical protein
VIVTVPGETPERIPEDDPIVPIVASLTVQDPAAEVEE